MSPARPGTAQKLRFTLPAREFKNGLARAIIELRRRLALHREAPADAANDLEALAQAPKNFEGHSGIFLNTVAVAALLRANDSGAGLEEAQQRMWIIALALDGALPETTQQALDDEMKALQRALDEHDRRKTLRADLAKRNGKTAPGPRQSPERHRPPGHEARQDADLRSPAQHFSAPMLDRLMHAMEKAMREGRTADAGQAAATAENAGETRQGPNPLAEGSPPGGAERKARGRSGRRAGPMQREAGLMDRAQTRAPRPALPPQLQGMFPPPPPDPDQLEANEESRGQDAATQRALRQAVEALKGALRGAGGQVPQGLNDAGTDMQAATDALTQGEEPAARAAEAKAIDDLRKGGQQMQRQREENAQMAVVPGARQQGEQGEEDGMEGGEEDGQHDPLGRPLKQGVGGKAADDNSVHVPDQMEQLRSREIQEELRRRGADRQRRQEELDYINRLLKPF